MGSYSLSSSVGTAFVSSSSQDGSSTSTSAFSDDDDDGTIIITRFSASNDVVQFCGPIHHGHFGHPAHLSLEDQAMASRGTKTRFYRHFRRYCFLLFVHGKTVNGTPSTFFENNRTIGVDVRIGGHYIEVVRSRCTTVGQRGCLFGTRMGVVAINPDHVSIGHPA